MKIYVVGSNSFVYKMVKVKDELIALGFDGWIHPNYEAVARGTRKPISPQATDAERAKVKRENDYLKVHYQHICKSDAILVVNEIKNGIENYIGGNVLIEMGQAYVHDKTIFLLHDTPVNMPYAAEIECMDPICLHGDLNNINNRK